MAVTTFWTKRRLGAVAAIAALAGCDDGGGATAATDVSTGGDVPVATGTSQIARPAGITSCTDGTATKSAVTCVETAVTVDPVTPDSACDAGEIMALDGALTYPWGGARVGAKSFTCNGCPNGHPELQGRFRAHGFVDDSDEPDYRYPDAETDFATVLFVDGNTFYSAEVDSKEGTSWQSRGFYICSMAPENSGQHLYWFDLDDSGAIVNVTRTDVVLSAGVDNLQLYYFNSATDISDRSGRAYAYCRIGTSRGGQVCNSPFLD